MSALIARRSVRRSEYVEPIVALALKDSGWTRMTPWDSWDCEHESGSRLEVKQSAVAQGWGTERSSPPRFDIAPPNGVLGQRRLGRPDRTPCRYLRVCLARRAT